ncbi:MAG: chemotaxis protein CheW [Spirochaetales bacterium]|nr:chemotaxis protein CheW [Spirochaetales bacterium]
MENNINEKDQYLTFQLDEVYAFPVLKVVEVLETAAITRVPGAPFFISGVINSRGSVIPVIDLRKKLGIGEVVRSADSRIIILDVCLHEECTQLGILVDKVLEVYSFLPEDIEEKPSMGMNMKMEYIQGVGKKGDQFIVLLSIDTLLSLDELTVRASA